MRTRPTLAATTAYGTSSTAGRRIKVWIYGLAALLIFLSTASLMFIAHLAWREADRQALESEQLRFGNALAENHRQIARDQIELVQWDPSFAAVTAPIDQDFIKDELVEDLWEDFGLPRTFIVDPAGSLIAGAIENRVSFSEADQPPRPLLVDLAEQTRAAFIEKQRTSGSIFAEWYLPHDALIDVSMSAFAIVDGQPAIVSTMPILPDEGLVQLDGPYPSILINAVYLDDDWLQDVNSQLAFNDFRFTEGPPEKRQPYHYVVASADGSAVGYFRWDHSKPGRNIWYAALPLVLLITAIIAVVSIAIANKISRLSASLEESERKNRHFARHDALTGLPNRHHFSDCLSYALDAQPEKGFAVMACDLDKFKPVNDTYGHEAGDRVLCEVADRLQALMGKAGVVSRIGGDEFVILITAFSDAATLKTVADKILNSIARPIDIGAEKTVMIGMSIGIAQAPAHGTGETELIRSADTALYTAKQRGRNMCVFAGSGQLEAAQDTQAENVHKLKQQQ
ncbi:diguanylate cyclase [Roseibium denhamense]|uniref:Diguanylate cyclase (GGDEF) domain-containing protein n=1 Tax=Roseibium denhamense TaxID=76305 RepID=A0ABY1NUD6_9HYPH|nr:diguanylate cyclase [Roseibium denhamense]MTI05450.1 diguanylate cyclase [Roseibium denhamense]SMP18599.1 diguanylate cyclase (GGDEF) domain-containing protein [Roseibium denhamense]